MMLARFEGRPGRFSHRTSPVRGVAVDGDAVWGLTTDALLRFGPDGAREERVRFDAESSVPALLVSDRDHVFYWLRPRGGRSWRLYALSKSGGSPRELPTEPDGVECPYRMHAGASRLFWTGVVSGDEQSNLRLCATAKDGSTTHALGRAEDRPPHRDAFAVRGDEVAWAVGGGGPRMVRRYAIDQGPQLVVVEEWSIAEAAPPRVVIYGEGTVVSSEVALAHETRVLAIDAEALYHRSTEPTSDGSRDVLLRTTRDGSRSDRLALGDAFALHGLIDIGSALVCTFGPTFSGAGDDPARIVLVPKSAAPAVPVMIACSADNVFSFVDADASTVACVEVAHGESAMDEAEATVSRLRLHARSVGTPAQNGT